VVLRSNGNSNRKGSKWGFADLYDEDLERASANSTTNKKAFNIYANKESFERNVSPDNRGTSDMVGGAIGATL
jgi:hypothetical protein